MRVLIFHNILWAHYKAAVFSELHRLAEKNKIDVRFVQIAATASDRIGLTKVDLSFHKYPYELLFPGSYQDSNLFVRAWRLVKAVRKNSPDLVVLPGYDDLAYWMLWLYCLVGVRWRVLTLDSTYQDHTRVWYKEAIKKIFIAGCNAGFTYGQRGREYLASLGMPLARIVVRCQAAPNEYLLEASKQAHESPLFVSTMKGRKFFLYVGRLAPEKDLGTLIRAFSVFTQGNPEYKLCLIGEGASRNELQELTASLDLVDKVSFLGARELKDLVSFYKNAVAFILPSLSEPWGLVVNEALLMKCPVIVSDRCGCVPDLVIEGITGYRFSAGSPKELTDAMLKFVGNDAQRLKMGEYCRALISEYNPEAAANQMLDCFEKFDTRAWR